MPPEKREIEKLAGLLKIAKQLIGRPEAEDNDRNFKEAEEYLIGKEKNE